MRRVFPTTVSFCLLVLLFSLCPTPAISQDSPTPYSKTAPESPQNADKGQTSKGYSLRDGNEPTGGNRPLEDFKSLNVASDLPFDVLALQDADFSGYRKELVRAQWRAGDPVDLYILRPAGVKKPPVVLYLYSYPTTLDRYMHPEVCQQLTKDGMAAIGFLPALTSDRFVARPMKTWFVSELQESLGTSVHDVQLILNYLEKRGDFDMSRVGMFGDGAGATVAILAAAADPRIKVLDLLDPWGDWPDWMAKSSLVPENERPDYLKPEFLEKVQNLDPVKWLPELKSQHVRLQHIEDIKVTPAEVRKRLESAAPPNVEIVHYETTKSFLMDVAAKGKALDWLRDQLNGTATQSASAPTPVRSDGAVLK